MAEFGDEMAESGGIWRNISEIWQKMATYLRNPARFGGKMQNFEGIWRKISKFGEIVQNLMKKGEIF